MPRKGDSRHTKDEAVSYHAEPTSPAAEHIAPELRRYRVHAEAEGVAVVYVDAPDEDEAIELAYLNELCGIRIQGGEATWSVTDVEEVEPDAN